MFNRLSARGLAAGSILVSLLVLALKLLAAWSTGSVALLSDALESLVNVAGAVIAWAALRYAARPADDNHPFGHHKAEHVSAVIEGLFVIAAAGLILWQAVPQLWSPAALTAAPLGLAVAGLAAGLNGLWARGLKARGAALRSPALVASGRHLMSDVWTTLGVLGGLALVALTGWAVLDPVLAILVALNILREGTTVVLSSAGGLMDEAADAEDRSAIEVAIRASMGEALQAHDLKTRRAGAALFVEFHLVVPAQMTVGAAHDICDRIEAAIVAARPDAVPTIHVEPDHKAKPHALQPADRAVG